MLLGDWVSAPLLEFLADERWAADRPLGETVGERGAVHPPLDPLDVERVGPDHQRREHFLNQGDGAAIGDEKTVDLKGGANSEVLLFDLA